MKGNGLQSEEVSLRAHGTHGREKAAQGGPGTAVLDTTQALDAPIMFNGSHTKALFVIGHTVNRRK